MKQLFFAITFITFLCFSLLSQTHLHLCFICFVHLFWRVNQMSENRRCFVSRTFLVVYDSFPLFWEFVVECCRSGLMRQTAEGR